MTHSLTIIVLTVLLSQSVPTLLANDTNKRSRTKINRQNIQKIRCKNCHYVYTQGLRKCKECNSSLEWLCICGVWRSYSNLSSHNCKTTKKRKLLKEKFRKEKTRVKKNISNARNNVLDIRKNPPYTHKINKQIKNIINSLSSLRDDAKSLPVSVFMKLKNTELSVNSKIFILDWLTSRKSSQQIISDVSTIFSPKIKKMSIQYICND